MSGRSKVTIRDLQERRNLMDGPRSSLSVPSFEGLHGMRVMTDVEGGSRLWVEVTRPLIRWTFYVQAGVVIAVLRFDLFQD